MIFGRIAVALVTVLVVGGCVPMPAVQTLDLEAPPSWDTRSPGSDLGADEFWDAFGSQALLDLQHQATLANPDLLIAIHRLRIARDAVLAAQGQRQASLVFNAGPVDNAAIAVADSRARRQAVFELGFEASYELDLWGRLDGLASSAQAEADAQGFDVGEVRIGLMSLVADAWFDVAQEDDMRPLLERRLALAEERLALQDVRRSAGRIDGATVSDARGAVAELQQQLGQSVRRRRDAERRVALLLGRAPEGFLLERAPLRTCVNVPPVPGGLPSTLLQRRPGLRAAQARWKAALAKIGVAYAEQFPEVRMTAQLGIATDVLHRLANGAVGLFGFGPSVGLPVLDGGERAANIDVRAQEAEIASLEYRKAAVAAFADVEHALAMHEDARAQQESATDRTARAREGVRRADAQRNAGYASRLEVITAEEQRIDAEALELQGHRARINSLMAMFQALGGGWQPTQANDAASGVAG